MITNSTDTLNTLLTTFSSGIDLDRKNAAGNTALHWAALNGHLAVVQALVRAGADVGVLNGVGQDAVFAAEAGGKEEVAGWLLKEGKGLESGVSGERGGVGMGPEGEGGGGGEEEFGMMGEEEVEEVLAPR